MRARELLMEGTDNLYHFTTIGAAVDVLKNGEFKLTLSEGNETEKILAHKNYKYYLSTTRSKVGDYTLTSTYKSGVVMNLDGRWLNQRYPVKPIDYWDGMWINTPGRTSEAEDRVYSKESTIPSTPIQSIHVLHADGTDKNRNKRTRDLLLLAKTKNIPIYMYTSLNAFFTQNTKKSVSIGDMAGSLKGTRVFSGGVYKSRFLDVWFELIYKKEIKELSDYGLREMKKILGYRYPDNKDFGLKNDLRNAMKPHSVGYDSAVKMEKIMRKNRYTDVNDLVTDLIAKWEPIYKKYNDEVSAKWHLEKEKEKEKELTTESVLTEARRNSVILVDFQPAYQSGDFGYDDAIETAIHYINEKKPNVTAFYNGQDVGIEDTKEEVMYHYIEHGLDEELTGLFTFKEKSYAWLRGWMDQGVDNSTIIKVVRYLVMNKLTDTRDIEEETLLKLVGDDGGDWMFDDGIYIPDIHIGDLKALSGSLMGGGHRDECFKELILFMNAFNIKYKIVDGWIYG